MPRGFGRLPFLNRRPGRGDGSDRLLPALPKPPLDAELAAVGPPVLLPAMIYRQILFDASEMTPVWARRGQEEPVGSPVAEAATPDPVKPRRPRRARTSPPSPPGVEAGDAKPKRPRKARPVSS